MAVAGEAREWPVTLVWGLLVAASIAGALLAESYPVARIAETATILLAAIKIHLVFRQYMELQWRHGPITMLVHIWLAVVSVLLIATCWLV